MNSSFFSCFLFLSLTTTGIGCSRIKRQDDTEYYYWNETVSSLLQNISAEIIQEQGNYIAVYDYHFNFGWKLFDVELKASGGAFGNLSTLRFVNVTTSTTPDSLTVFVQVKLDQVEVMYSHFEAFLMFLSVDGSFRASLARNLLTTQVTLKLDDANNCEAVLDVFELTEFDGIDLTINGLDLVNKNFASRIANMIINNFAPDLKPMADEKLKKLILPYVSLACEYLDNYDVDNL